MPQPRKDTYFRKDRNAYYGRYRTDTGVVHRKLLELKEATALSKTELTQKLAERYKEEHPTLTPLTPATIAQAAELWLAAVAVAPRTRRDYRLAVTSFLSVLPKTSLSDLRESDSSYLIRELTANGRSNATIHSYLRTTQIFLHWCAEQEWMPLLKLRKPAQEKREARVYSAENIQRILEKLAEDKRTNLFRMILLMRYTGMRAGEVWSLPLRHIQLATKELHLRAVPELAWKPKKGKEATLPIVEKLATFLKTDLANRGEQERFYLDKGNGEPAYVGVAQMSRALRPTLIALGIYRQQKSLHGFRAAVITMLLQEGVPPVVVQSIARHEDLSTTMRYYNRAEENTRAALEQL